jgi:hypothetical protein
MWTLILCISINRVCAFETFTEFQTLAECTAVMEPWIQVPVNHGHIALAACQRLRLCHGR